MPTIVVFIFPVLLCSVVLCAVLCCAVLLWAVLYHSSSFLPLLCIFAFSLTSFPHVATPTSTWKSVRFLSNTSAPLSHVPSAVGDKPTPSAPIPGAHATSPPISGLYFRASLYSHRFFCTLQCSKLLTIRVSLECEFSLPLSPSYMPCIRP